MLSDYFCLSVCTEISCMRFSFVQKNETWEHWNELQFAFWGHVILDGLKTWQFCVFFFFPVFLAVQVYTCLSLNQKRTLKFSVWSIMYTLVSSSFGMGPCRARAGGSQSSKIHQPPVTRGSHRVLPWTALWLLQHAAVWFLGSHLWTTGGKDLPKHWTLVLPSRMALGFGLSLFPWVSSVGIPERSSLREWSKKLEACICCCWHLIKLNIPKGVFPRVQIQHRHWTLVCVLSFIDVSCFSVITVNDYRNDI